MQPSRNAVEVVHAYTAQQADELSLQPGAIVSCVEEISADWWRGALGSRVGVFPSSFVRRLYAPAFYVRALWDFSTMEDMELPLIRGDLVYVTDEEVGGEWYYGSLQRTRRSGWFPAKLVGRLHAMEFLSARAAPAAPWLQAEPLQAAAAAPKKRSSSRRTAGSREAESPLEPRHVDVVGGSKHSRSMIFRRVMSKQKLAKQEPPPAKPAAAAGSGPNHIRSDVFDDSARARAVLTVSRVEGPIGNPALYMSVALESAARGEVALLFGPRRRPTSWRG
jgi:hypothetical protein